MNQTPDQLHTDQMKDTVAFPVLSAAELEECAEFGTRCSFAAGEDLFRAGAQPFDCYVILSGERVEPRTSSIKSGTSFSIKSGRSDVI